MGGIFSIRSVRRNTAGGTYTGGPRELSEHESSRLNAFGDRLYSPTEVLDDEVLAHVLKPTFLRICKELSVSDQEADLLVQKIWDTSRNISTQTFEAELQRIFNALVPSEVMRAALDRRAALIAKQVFPFIIGENVADIGCGDGLVAWYLKRHAKRIMLVDVYCYLDPRVSLPYYGYQEGEPLPLIEEADTSLLLTVLHHAEDPIKLLCETRRITRSRLLVIESVFGVDADAGGPPSVLHHLDHQRQRKYATFVDYLYNRVFHDGVPVPFNYSTPSGWQRIFQSTGWDVQHVIDLGIDQPIVPEHHILYALNVA